MKIALISRPNEEIKWGGDLKALRVIQEGIRALGHEAALLSSLEGIEAYDFIFFSITCYLDLRRDKEFVQMLGKRYGLICFHENLIREWGPAQGLFRYVRSVLDGKHDEGLPFSIERLLEMPHLIYYYATPPHKAPLVNYEVIKEAEVCIASSKTEANTILRDCPTARVQTVHWTPGIAEGKIDLTEEFLRFTGLSSGGYILQIGRFEPRKNHLSTILATKETDLPLVFIATAQYHSLDQTIGLYEKTCLEAAYRFRKAPTYIVHQTLPTMHTDKLHVLQMPEGKKLTDTMLLSAHGHATVHLHPAFSELPGYTYLESAKLGIPTIASSWAAIADYFPEDPTLDGLIDYAAPYDIPQLTRLVEKKAHQKKRPIDQPAFHRKAIDVATEIMETLFDGFL